MSHFVGFNKNISSDSGEVMEKVARVVGFINTEILGSNSKFSDDAKL